MTDVRDHTVVFLVGAPRSGTTYLQNLLGAHPRVVTTQETDLFTSYIPSLREHWNRQLPQDPDQWLRIRHKGLPAVLTESEFDDIVAEVVKRVYDATLALKPGASIILDKTPHNSHFAATIQRYVPRARFIHIIRDGRDVISSQLRAARGWGWSWAAPSAEAASMRWRRDIVASRAIAQTTAPYLEVRYEDLAGEEGPAVLRQAIQFCGLDATPDEVARIHASFTLSEERPPSSSLAWGGEVVRRLGHAPPEPPGFAGEGGIGTWRRDLDERARIVIEHRVGDLLLALGYTKSPDWVGSTRLRRAVVAGTLLFGAMARRGRRELAQIIQV